jgi:hypothetical protein
MTNKRDRPTGGPPLLSEVFPPVAVVAARLGSSIAFYTSMMTRTVVLAVAPLIPLFDVVGEFRQVTSLT